MSDFTPEEIAWARAEIVRRVDEDNRLAVSIPWNRHRLRKQTNVARSKRSRAAGLSRARHHALLKFVEGDSDGR